MANTKISQLPSWTGTAADLRWFVMNNSGESETYKYSGYSSQLIPGTGTDSYRTPTQTSPSPYDINVGGSGKTFSDTYGGNVSIGGDTNIISGTRGFKTIINGSNNEITGSAKWVSIFGGRNNRINDGDYGMTIIGGESNYINTCSYGSAIIGSASSTLTQVGTSLLGGGYSCSMTNTNDSVSLGGRSNQLTNNYQTGGSANIAGEGNTLSANHSAIIGGSLNTLSQFTSVIVCSISSTISGAGSMSGVYSSQSSTINADGTYNIIIGGFGNVISGGSAAFSSIIGSYNSSLVNRNNSVMLGTSGRTGTSDYTTYVENIHSFRTPSTQVQPVSSGTTFTCNLDGGAKSQFYITGTSTINITNVRDGASFMIKTETDGNYVMTWTATGGYTFVFEGGIKDPGNTTTDIFVFEVFGSVIYGSRRHNFS